MAQKYSYLTFEDRKRIELLYNKGLPIERIANVMHKSRAAMYVELRRGYTGGRNAQMKRAYSAERAQTVFQDSLARRGRRSTAATDNYADPFYQP